MTAADRRTPPRRLAVMLAAVPLLAAGVADGAAVLARHTSSIPAGRTSNAHARTTEQRAAATQQQATAARTAAIRSLLARRGDAVMRHDRAEWRSTLDPAGGPAAARFRRQQMRMFDNLQKVPFASWSYSFEPTATQMRNPNAGRYDATTWSPLRFALRYRLAQFDDRSSDLPQYPTFVDRSGHWYLASLSDFAKRGLHSARDLWDFGPVVTVKGPNVLVLGHPAQRSLMESVSVEVAADIPRVSAVWGTDWSRRAVVLVPSSQHELGQVVDDSGDLDNIAAVATAEVAIGSGKPDPVGDRIGVNTSNWPQLSPLGQRIVLTHELTHVATRAVTSAATPTWLAEGFADYVGYLNSGVPTPFVAQDLGQEVHAGRVPSRLPPAGQFNGANARLSQAYEGSWLACRLIVQRWGQPALVRLYRAVGLSHQRAPASVATAMRRVLHVSASSFVAQWREFVQRELA